MLKVCQVIRNGSEHANSMADMIEVRADCVKSPYFLTKKTKILTVRRKKEGGKWEGSEKERQELIIKLLPNFDFVDIELGSGIMKNVLKLSNRMGKRAIVSYHNIKKTPKLSVLKKVFVAASRHGMPKIATRINAFGDIMVLMDLARFSGGRCIIVGMGTLGKITRILFPLMGCPWTYGTLEKSELITIKELRRYWDAF